jgi:release factor glutamine methyltransferase
MNATGAGTSVRQALHEARLAGVERLDAQLLLARLLGQTRSWLLGHDEVPLDAVQSEAFRAGLARLAGGEPLAYLFGEKEFHGLRLDVRAGVLVPRPDTETLVDWALELLASGTLPGSDTRVLDLGTGSGAIALAVKHRMPSVQVCATDISDDALAIAGANARRLGLSVDLLASHWWQRLVNRRFELVLSNPPYIAEGDPHLPALAHEPHLALVSGPDGLDAIRAIVAGAPDHLAPGGWLLLEHGHDQAEAVRTLLAAAGLVDIQSRRDLPGIPRCSGGRCHPRIK